MNPGHLAPGSLFLTLGYPELEPLRLVGKWGGDTSRIQGRGARGQGNECSPTPSWKDPCQLASARSLYYINLALHSSGLSPTPPAPHCLTQDSGQLFTYFVGETASSENMTFAQNVAGQPESLPGMALPSQGPNPCRRPGQATGALGVPGCPPRHTGERGGGEEPLF